MKKYEVEMAENVRYTYTIEVEAESEED